MTDDNKNNSGVDNTENENINGEKNNGQNQDENQGQENEDKPKTYTEEEVKKMLSEKENDIIKYKRMAEQRAKKLENDGTDKSNKNDKGLDYGEKAFLKSSGISGNEEIAIVEEAMKYTGKTLEEVIEHPFVKAELKNLREAKATADAMPKNNNRGTTNSKSNIDYWIQKGELPPNTPENTDLRRKVVNERLKRTQNFNKFGGDQ